jgi:hypothetical protein
MCDLASIALVYEGSGLGCAFLGRRELIRGMREKRLPGALRLLAIITVSLVWPRLVVAAFGDAEELAGIYRQRRTKGYTVYGEGRRYGR